MVNAIPDLHDKTYKIQNVTVHGYNKDNKYDFSSRSNWTRSQRS